MHSSVAGPRERCHEGSLADNRQIRLRGGIQQVIFDAEDLVVATAQDAATNNTHRIRRGGSVKGLGSAGTPVDDERLIVSVPYPDSPDVTHLVVSQIKSAEDQTFMLSVKDR